MSPVQPVASPGLALEAPLPDAGEEMEGSVAQVFEKAVALYADLVAVEAETGRVTYAELNRQVNRVAVGLLEQAGATCEPVALLMTHDTPIIAAIFGILKAGKFFSVLDPDHPPAYLRALLDDLDAHWLITDQAHLALAQEIASDRREVALIESLAVGDGETSPRLILSGDAPSLILYTSGSTGRPKGVVYPQREVLYYARLDRAQSGVRPHDHLALFAPLAFGSPLSNLINGLLNGATLFPFNARYHSLEVLSEWLVHNGITILRPPIGLTRQWLNSLAPGQTFPALRLVSLVGDILHRQDVLRFRQHVRPECQFIYRYGATETSVVTWMAIDPDRDLQSEVIPVGYPVPGREVLILDENRQPVPPGEQGEIVVRARSMALGYWRRPTLTAERFFDDPTEPGMRLYFTGDFGRFLPDGQLALVGRRDAQVKIRGFRVGLGTVESALLDQPVVSEAAVFAQPGPTDEKRIVAYVVLKDKSYPLDHLRQALAEVLPAHMLPAAFVTLDALPLTANGKVNRHALPLPGRERPALAAAYVAPRTATETQLAGIWRDVLGIEGIGVQDRFLDLGGDSLLAAQVVSRVHRAFQVPIPVRVLLQAATIADMAALLDAEAEGRQLERLPDLVRELEQLSEAEAERLLDESRGAEALR